MTSSTDSHDAAAAVPGPGDTAPARPQRSKPQDIADAISYVRPGHPREAGIWQQYSNLTTRLRGRAFFADYITEGDRWELFDGTEAQKIPLDQQKPENYHDTHNHYQTLMAEVLNFSPQTNAVPIWGDGTAMVHGASAWGAFVSARSHFHDLTEPYWARFLPAGPPPPAQEEFDCQLCALEVDVLNGGKPGVYPNKAKHAIQVVGFGNPNSHALSVICENFDCEPERRRGQFESGIYFQNSIHPDYGRAFVADFDRAQIGIDFRKPVFDHGAIQLNAPTLGSGLIFSEGRGGEVFAGSRQPGQDTPQWLTLRMGQEGLRIVSNDGQRELIAVDVYGGIYLNGDVFVNGRKLQFAAPPAPIGQRLREALAAAARGIGQGWQALTRRLLGGRQQA